MPRSLLLCAALCLALVSPAAAQQVFINELHYDNVSTDTGEFVEVAGPAGTDLSGWSIVLYNGANGEVYDTINLSGTIPNQQNGYGTLDFSRTGIQNGAPDGLALVAPGNTVVQFLSYEGSFTADAGQGPAGGQTSQDIGVDEDPAPAAGNSLQLTGTGTSYADFTWSGPSAESPGAVNTGQTFPASSVTPIALDIFFNEAHYEDSAPVTDTFLELVTGPALSVPLSDLFVVLYEAATGQPATIPPGLPNAGDPAIVPLSLFTPGQTVGAFAFYTFSGDTAPLFANDGDALAICYDDGSPTGTVVTNGGQTQFLSQNGTTTATVGCAAGLTSTDLGVSEDETTPPGASIGLTDGGSTPVGGGTNFGEFMPTDFAFVGAANLPFVATPGGPNYEQTLFTGVTCPAPFSITNYKVSPNSGEFVAIATQPGISLVNLYLVAIDGATGNVYYSQALTGTTDAGDGSYLIGASGVAGRDQALPNGTLQNGVDLLGIITRDAAIGSSVGSIAFPDEICASLIYGSGSVTLGAYNTPPPTATKQALPQTDLATQLAQAVAASEIDAVAGEVPTSFALEQNYPNPFNPSTQIRFALPEASDVSLVVYDVLGRTVRELATGRMEAGTHAVAFDASTLPSGLYVYRLQAGSFEQTRQMLLLK